jgi:hypothetical protein
MSRLKLAVDREWTWHPSTVDAPVQREEGTRYRLRLRMRFGPNGDMAEPAAESGEPGTRSVGDPTLELGLAVQGSLQPAAGDGLRGDAGPPDNLGAGVMGISLSSSPGTVNDFRPGEGGATVDRGGGKTQASTPRSPVRALTLLSEGSGVRVTIIAMGS